MQSVAQGYDPGNALFAQWFKSHRVRDRSLVVNIGGGKSQVWPFLAEHFPSLKVEVRDASQALLTQRQESLSAKLKGRVTFKQHDLYASQPPKDAAEVYAYVMWNVCWNLDDANCVRLLQTFVPVLEESPQTILLMNEGMSPPKGMFEQHIDHAYRRRDVTAMTMHNTKLRSEEEWRELFNQASPYFKVRSHKRFTPSSFLTCFFPDSGVSWTFPLTNTRS
jgi:trans-aconitate methyltransferase